MKTIILTALLLVGTLITPAQTADTIDISFVAVSNVCGAPSDVNVSMTGILNSVINVDVILLDDNGSPFSLVESKRITPSGYVTFFQVQPCQSYWIKPRVVKGEGKVFKPTFIRIDVQDGNPFNLEFVATAIDN